MERQLRISRTLNVILAAIVVALIIVVVIQMTDRSAASGAQSGATPAVTAESGGPVGSAGTDADSEPHDNTSYVRNDPADPMAIGSIDAPVVLSEWVDFRCPYCAIFTNETLPILVEEYVNTGKLRIEFNDVYFFGDQSENAAIAARAAAEQGRYYQYAQVLFANAAGQSGHPDLPWETLMEFGITAGVPDMEQFVADLESPEIIQEVEASQELAQSLGISSVPFFVIDGQAFSGAQTIETFREILDSQM